MGEFFESVDSSEIDVVIGDRSLPKTRKVTVDRRKPRPSAEICRRERSSVVVCRRENEDLD